MKKTRGNNWTELLFFLLVVSLFIILLYIFTYIGIKHFWIGERTDNLEKIFLEPEYICDVYDLNLTEKDMIYRMERHSFRDSITYYTLYIRINNISEFTEDNQETISMYQICNNSNFSKRPSTYPCIYYKGNTIVIITSDLRSDKFNKSNTDYQVEYSDRIADYFDSCFIEK